MANISSRNTLTAEKSKIIHGYSFFVEKTNWKKLLTAFNVILAGQKFFFYFSSERGHHLKVFTSKLDVLTLDKFKKTLQSFEPYEPKEGIDALFKEAQGNSVCSISGIDEELVPLISNDAAFDSICNTCQLIIDALDHNDFFLDEKFRLNFAIQLFFLSVIEIGNKTFLSFMKEELMIPKRLWEEMKFREVDPSLLEFYNNLQHIYTDQGTKKWVKDWIELNKTNFEQSLYLTNLQNLCNVLEVHTFFEEAINTLICVALKQ